MISEKKISPTYEKKVRSFHWKHFTKMEKLSRYSIKFSPVKNNQIFKMDVLRVYLVQNLMVF